MDAEGANVDEVIFWGAVAVSLFLITVPFWKGSQKWAFVSLFGTLLAILIASALGADGNIVVAYSTNCPVSTCFSTPITNSDNLPLTIVLFIALFGFFVTIAKGLDYI